MQARSGVRQPDPITSPGLVVGRGDHREAGAKYLSPRRPGPVTEPAAPSAPRGRAVSRVRPGRGPAHVALAGQPDFLTSNGTVPTWFPAESTNSLRSGDRTGNRRAEELVSALPDIGLILADPVGPAELGDVLEERVLANELRERDAVSRAAPSASRPWAWSSQTMAGRSCYRRGRR